MDQPVAVVETHISVLLLLGDRAYKLKKPVHLPFLDWRTREARRAMCLREVDLNRRLAPDVYLGVLDVVRDGEPVDHLVEMRRLPEERRLSTLASGGAEIADGLRQLAVLLADFHAGAVRSAAVDACVGIDALRRRWAANLESLRAHGGIVPPEQVDRVEHLVDRYLDGREELFRRRVEAGCAVDGHGDLLADDVYLLDDGPRPIDCLEFRDDLRYVDVLDDVASLAMDLERLGAVEAAQTFVDAYVDRSGERHPASLLDHYVAYRAGVRAVVAAVRADQRNGAGGDAGRLLQLAHDHLRDGRVRLVLLGGLPGTGKSTLAGALGAATGWPVLRSDVVRKELSGLEPLERAPAPYGSGLYGPEATEATYAEVLARARTLAGLGASVVLDASWIDPDRRAAARAAAIACGAEVVELRCEAPPEVAAERIRRRGDRDASDATTAVAADMARRAAPWPEAVVVTTSGTVAEALAAAIAAVA